MHFSNTAKDTGTKFTKIAIVTALHAVVGVALIHNMDAKTFAMPKALEEIVMFTPEAPKPPPPPPEPPTPKQKAVTQPKVVAPPVEVEVPQEPPPESVVQATAEPQPAADPGPATPEAPAKSANEGKVFTAALANAGDCAKPDYPASAARNGDQGTVKLALLIGADGHVTDSKIQHSSGSRDLDRAAVNALSLCKFKPATNGGVAEPAWGQIAYVWTLD